MMKKVIWKAVLLLLLLAGCGDGDGPSAYTSKAGWAIGDDLDSTAVILHTDNGGITWEVQGDSSLWKGHYATDISAVDEGTAWAAVGQAASEGGMILHTGDGGSTWNVQALPRAIPIFLRAFPLV